MMVYIIKKFKILKENDVCKITRSVPTLFTKQKKDNRVNEKRL